MSNVVTNVNDPYYTMRVDAGSASFTVVITARADESYDSDFLTPAQAAVLDDVIPTIVQALTDRSDITQAVATRYETSKTYILPA